MAGIGEHHDLHRLGEVPVDPARDLGERVERVDRLAPGEGQRGADLLEGEAQLREAREGLGALVVGRMGLQHDALVVGRRPRAGPGRGPGEAVDLHGAELHARLDHEPADPAEAAEGVHVGVERGAGGLGARGRDAVLAGAGAAGGRDLGADDEEEAVGGDRLGRRAGERGGAGDGLVVGQLGGLARAALGAVEVDLGEAGLGIGADHGVGLGHGLLRREVPPGLGAEVVAAEDDRRAVEPGLVGEPVDHGHEVRGRLAGVAAVLVHLVRGRLDHQGAAEGAGEAQRGLDHLRVGGADRGDGGARARAAAGDDVLEDGAHGVTGCRRTPWTTRLRVPWPSKGSSTLKA